MRFNDKYITLEAMDMAIGETSRKIACPTCQARGDLRAGSLLVTRNEQGLFYKCFRASCSAVGFIPTISELNTSPKKKDKPLKEFNRPLCRVPNNIRKWLFTKYGITTDDIAKNHFRLDFTVNYLHMMLYNHMGYEIGSCIKKLPEEFLRKGVDVHYWDTRPKVINYPISLELPLLHFPIGEMHHVNTPIVVVEDVLSAVRLRQFGPSASLMGTTMTDDKVKQLRGQSNRLILALDNDTWDSKNPLPLKYKQKYGLFFNEFKVVLLKKDPKDMTDLEIETQILR